MLARADRRNLFNLANQLWNTDSSFKRIPAKCSLLSARELPSPGPIDLAKELSLFAGVPIGADWDPPRTKMPS